MQRLAKWQGQVGKVVQEQIGRVLVDFGDSRPYWIIKGLPGLYIYDHKGRGRPAKHQSKADKQRAYRERKKGNPLRKYRLKESGQ